MAVPALATVEQVDAEIERQKLTDRLKAIIGRLEAEATKRVSARRHIEQRWIEDLEQYHGRYDQKTLAALQDTQKSKLFLNMTRPKTDAMSARLMDLLFPTDDRNWGIKPTPVPSLTEQAEMAAATARQMQDEAKEAAEQAQMEGQEVDPARLEEVKALEAQAHAAKQAAADANAILDEARRRAELMENEIADQLKESRYHAIMRDVIEDAAKLGTGVCKGPVTGDRVRKGWKKQEGEEYSLQMSNGDHPAIRYVDIWSFFPDMDARTIDEGEGDLERHLMNRKKLRKLAQLPGFDAHAVRRLLKAGPQTAAPSYLADLRNITSASQQITSDLFHVWEYSGCLEPDDMRDLALAMGDEDMLTDLEDIDPLTEVNAVVWFCQGEILKFSIYPYDSGETMYSVFNLAKDEASVFGYGIPAIMRDPQKSLNAAWRAMMDNAGLTAGPQIVMARQYIEPADGTWNMSPFKVWLAKDGLPQDKRAIDFFDIVNQQAPMANIVAMSQRFIDDMTAMPAIAQGEQGVGVTKTAQGMALLMNSANVVFRRIVKNFDDDVTTPNIRRFYDWNMQFSDKQEIKGDYEVDARGSSVLLVREMQAQNLFMIAMHLGAHPVYGPMLKNRDLLRKLFQSHMIPADEVVLTDDEIDAILAQAAAEQQAGEADAARAELEARKLELQEREMESKIEIANMEMDGRLRIAQMQRDTQMMMFAEKMNMTTEELQAKLQISREEGDRRERKMAVEAAMTERTGPSGGGWF